MSTGSLATLGYAMKQAQWELENAMQVNPRTLLVDTRLMPACSWSIAWTRPHLQHAYGARYCWRGDWLGNVNYHRPDLPIRLRDQARGIPWIVAQLEAGTTCILLCACAQEERCHRLTIFQLVQAHMGERLPCFEPDQRVLTPDGSGVIVADIPLHVQRMRHRYAVAHDRPQPYGYRYYMPDQLTAPPSLRKEVV